MDQHFIDDAAYAAKRMADGAVVAHAFGNIYVISTRADAQTVKRVNLMKGRPPDQVGSIITTKPHIASLFDWSRLPVELDRETALALIDTLYSEGPFGFRGPAADWIPSHMASFDGDMRTTQIIAPGYACASNAFLDAAMENLGETMLYVTSANRSRHQTGAVEEPAHYAADGLWMDFRGEPDFLVVQHRDEAAARARYPRHAAMSTTVIALHKLGEADEYGRPTIVVERHGSLHVDDLAQIFDRFGFGLALAPLAMRRLTQRDYSAVAMEARA